MPSHEDPLERGIRAQLARLRAAARRGVPRVGWKLGINDRGVQQRMGIDAPVVGALDGECVLSSGDGFAPPPGAIPKVEAEIAICIGRDVAGDETPESARSAISGLCPAIEVVDYSKPSSSLEAILEHSVFHAAVAFGEPTPFGSPDRPDLAGLGVEWPSLFKNDLLSRTPAAELAPESLEAVVCRVASLLDRYDERLAAGDRVLSGSFTRPLGVQVGDCVRVSCGPLGEVALSIAG